MSCLPVHTLGNSHLSVMLVFSSYLQMHISRSLWIFPASSLPLCLLSPSYDLNWDFFNLLSSSPFLSFYEQRLGASLYFVFALELPRRTSKNIMFFVYIPVPQAEVFVPAHTSSGSSFYSNNQRRKRPKHLLRVFVLTLSTQGEVFVPSPDHSSMSLCFHLSSFTRDDACF